MAVFRCVDLAGFDRLSEECPALEQARPSGQTQLHKGVGSCKWFIGFPQRKTTGQVFRGASKSTAISKLFSLRPSA